MKVLIIAVISICMISCNEEANTEIEITNSAPMEQEDTLTKVEKTKAEWRAVLTAKQYKVTREKETERAFTGKYWDNKESGVYTCVACDLPLFDSKTKFKSGTGWPSFYATINDNYVGLVKDTSYGMVRNEVVCNRCDAHLGHLFNDGPRPTGLRYCINSAALNFHNR